MIGNILITFWVITISPLVFSLKINIQYLESLSKIYLSNILIAYIFMLSFIFFYIKPILDYLKTNNRLESISIENKTRILNAPILLSTMTFGAWIFAGVMGDINHYFYFNKITQESFIGVAKGLVFNIFNASLAFVIYFYTFEYGNGRWIIPFFFPNNILSIYKKTFRFTIMKRFRLYYSAISVYPLLLILTGVLRLKREFAPNEIDSILNSILLIIIFFLVVGLLVTYLITIVFQKPLMAMKDATRKIAESNFNKPLEVVSNDELGRLGEAINKMASEIKEKEFIKDTFGKLVDPEVRDYLLKGNMNRGGELKEVSILFSDIRGFTTISENLAPDRVVEILNLYFDRMSNCVSHNKGFVNKFIGDAIMAVFGAPIEQKNHASLSIQTAIDMKRELLEINKELEDLNLPKLKIGMGIHSGTVLAGNIGSINRMEYTVIGDTVNLASRLESMCKELETDLLFSEETFMLLNNNFKVQKKGVFTVRGRTKPTNLYTIT